MAAIPPRYAQLWDGHCHSEFGYCATTITVEKGVKGMRAAGIAGLSITEHAWQVYTAPGIDPWKWDWWRDPSRRAALWAEGRWRMDAYREAVGVWRGADVAMGLEVDVCADGALSLAPEDRADWDVLLGAVHRLSDDEAELSDDRARGLFLDATTALLSQGVQVLAHPFRWFVGAKRPQPTDLFEPVASLCKRYGAAAEINTHGENGNDPAFFRLCRDMGVKIALGTDTHKTEEIADMRGHLALLEAATIQESIWPDALFRPLPGVCARAGT